MKAKYQCSACGEELEEVKVKQSKWALLSIVPLLLMLPFLWQITRDEDQLKSLTLSDVEFRQSEETLEFVGILSNAGKKTARLLALQVELYDREGRFVDEEIVRLEFNVYPHSSENFKIEVDPRFARKAMQEQIEPKVKLARASTF